MSDPQNDAERSAAVRADRAESKNLKLEAQAVSLRLEVEDSARRARESEISAQVLRGKVAALEARIRELEAKAAIVLLRYEQARKLMDEAVVEARQCLLFSK